MRVLAASLLLGALVCGCSSQYSGRVLVYELPEEIRQLPESEFSREWRMVAINQGGNGVDLAEVPSLVELLEEIEAAEDVGTSGSEIRTGIDEEILRAGGSYVFRVTLEEHSPTMFGSREIELTGTACEGSEVLWCVSKSLIKDRPVQTTSGERASEPSDGNAIGGTSYTKTKYPWTADRARLWNAVFREFHTAAEASGTAGVP